MSGAMASPDDIESIDEKLKASLAEPTIVTEKPKLEAKAANDDKQGEMKLIAKTGKFDVHSGVGNKFFREHPKGSPERQEYDMLKSRDEKRLFRERWGKVTFRHLLETNTHEESYTTVDKTKGTYLTLGGVILQLGGFSWRPAITGALRLALKCTKMKGQWTFIDSWTGLQMFFVLSKEWEGVLVEKWSLFKKEIGEKQEISRPSTSDALPASGVDGSCAGALPSGAEGAGGGVVVAPVSKSAKGGRNSAPKAKAARDPNTPTAQITDKTPPPRGHIKDALRIKNMLAKNKMTALNLATQIDKYPNYKWARGQDNVGMLREALDKLETQMSDFHKDFMILEPKAMQKLYGDETFNVEVASFCTLRANAADLARITNMLLNMHAQRG